MSKADSKTVTDERLKFLRHLSKSGRRTSQGREIIFNEVMRSHGHFTAEELAKECLHKRLKVSRPTVFRVLHDLLEAGIIRETAFGDKHRHFEHVYDEKPHHHAQCVRCHRFIEFPDKEEEDVYHPYLERQGFKILGHEMHFYGICKDCQSSQK
ncbi:MAG: transcriptional repressor [Candidatus Omnitrophica bacterium]|nr:transcriptional repressor [Candidatus Omnitrophota bacterium]MDE2009167.1 transcriptional repressor [Candidatus Omnitrophota bacterium]MDE2213688.1 transcriptional repressor [Candidatus Omnitrophota bacterium]MDE2230737.1 transcriptional repressor [Candidatus Omnitrophota bacterium]